jgi:hypothetical protein
MVSQAIFQKKWGERHGVCQVFIETGDENEVTKGSGQKRSIHLEAK